MKLAAIIARYLLGLVFTVFGLNGFLHFIPQPPFPAGSHAAAFTGAMAATGYFAVVFAVQFLCGLAFFAGLYVPLTLVVVAPVIFNVLLFHSTMAPAGLPPGLFVLALWVVVAIRHRAAFAPLFRPTPAAPTTTTPSAA